FDLYNKRHKEITDIENSSDISVYLKTMLPKQKAYIARFALLIHFFDGFFTDDGAPMEIGLESMQKAIRLSDYFIENAKKVKSDNMEITLAKKIISKNSKKETKELVNILVKELPDLNKSKVADLLGVSRRS